MTNGRRPLAFVFTVILASLSGASLTPAGDWPMYRHDLARSGSTPDALQNPLHREWTHQPVHPPMPAWPEPCRELNRVAFDYAHDTVIAGGLAYFGSSADHKIYAVDLQTGRQRWCFFTEGPVRFAPAIEGGRLFAVSDDGRLYCLSADEGKLLWTFSGEPRREKIVGNERLISRWPLRGGVAVADRVVYFSAGMWPNEGVYLYAISAETGKVLWTNDTCGRDYRQQPHPPACSVTGVAPQGYLLGNEGQLFVPTGRNTAAAFDRGNGKLQYYHSRPRSWGDRWGGCWGMAADGLLLSWRTHFQPDVNVQLGEFPPDKEDGTAAFDSATGTIHRDFPGKLRLAVSGNTLYASGSGKLSAYDWKAWRDGAPLATCTRWETPHGRAYSLIVAGNTVLVGGRETVTAFDGEKGTQLWQDKVSGQVRSLAAANGRLLASTSEGRIVCYGPKPSARPPLVSSPKAASPYQADSPAVANAKRIIEQTGKRAGYCVVLGAGDGRLLYELASHSDLEVYCIEPDAQRADTVRQSLDAARLYGTRVTIHQGTLRTLRYPDYLADLLIVSPSGAADLTNWPAAEVRRVLRPCGGIAQVVVADAGGAAAVKQWLAEGKIPPEEIKNVDGAVQVVRGNLPGAANWTHQYATAARPGASTDTRVKLPVKLLWFGPPGPERLIARHWKGPAPLCVDGRLFVIGQYSLMAVDAYNGRRLWRRDLPSVGRFPVSSKGSNVAADQQSVYIATGRQCLRLDAVDGRTTATYQLPPAPAGLPEAEAKKHVWSYLAVGEMGILGSAGTVQEGKYVFMLDKDGKPLWTYAAKGIVGNNSLAMDSGRVYLIDRTNPADVAKAKKRGEDISAGATLLALDAATGKTAWQTTEGVAGRGELWLARGVLLATGGGMSGYQAESGKMLYNRAVRMSRFPVIVGDTIYGEPAAYNLLTGEPKTRRDAFTDEPAPWNFGRSYGCGSISGGANLLMFRSGTLGMYDLASDSGVHNFGGVRAGCHVNAIAAGGLMLMPPTDASCTCSYCYQTTVALMPAASPENWSIFYNRLPNTTLDRAALNFGAPADQRDADGRLWLGTPRPNTTARRRDIAVPFRFTYGSNANEQASGPYRRDSGLLSIAGTDRPWIYASGLKGLTRAELDLTILDRGIVSWPIEQPPAVDGKLADPCWNGYKRVALNGGGSVTLRYDDKNLYLAYEKPVATDALGKAVPWKAAASGVDPAVWKDDSFEFYLSNVSGRDQASQKYLHVGVSASGARYDAMWTYVTPALPVQDIPKLDVTVDGDPADWAGKGLSVVSLPCRDGKLRPAADFDPCFKLGWNNDGLLILAEVKDNIPRESADAARLTRGDSVEVFLAPKRGTPEGYSLAISPGCDPKHAESRSLLADRRKSTAGEKLEKLTARFVAKKATGGYLVELLLPWKNLKIAPAAGREFAMQLFVNDDDGRGDKYRCQALWHPAGNPRKDPLAYQTFRLADKPAAPIEFKRGTKRDRQGFFAAATPYPMPIKLPPLGAQPEDPKYNTAWLSAVRADGRMFSAEVSIPWTALAQSGLNRNSLMIDLNHRGPLGGPPVIGRGFERLLVVSSAVASPKKLSVRLHFAEIEGAKPGQRVFDVKLQDKVVLKDFDIAATAGNNYAVVKQFDGIVAAGALEVELVPKSAGPAPLSAPIISGIEIHTNRN